MKTLEQLGISPAPWNPADDGMGYNDILCNAPVTEDSEGENIIAETVGAKDARLMAAAPKLYEACYEMLRYYYEQNTNTTVFNTALELMKQAEAEAAGESEVTK